ncbi:MAG: DUF711 family protein [Thermomicrobium sp.]|nr:DUF711 family protein [Thermomicrobium sp.]
MRVRAVTIGWSARWESGAIVDREGLLDLASRLQTGLASCEFDVQTVRLATQPFPTIVRPTEVRAFSRQLCELGELAGFEYVCMGPVRPGDWEWVPELVEVLVREERLFASLLVTDQTGAVSLPAVATAGRVIRALADRTPAGFGNLRFAALALCPPGSPFFPAAYHDGGGPALGIAWEVADEAVEAFGEARSLAAAEQRLRERLGVAAARIVAFGERLAADLGIRFLGLDCSLAPYPDERHSVAGAFERLGVVPFGGPGTLAVAAMVTQALRELPVPRIGYCGLMLPVFEDAVLGKRAQEGRLHLADLLLAAAVCGVGLDVIPLPGDLSAVQLSAIVLDVATLATKVGKPLTARLMPVPGHRAGEVVRVDFPFFAPAGVLAVDGSVPPEWFGNDAGQNTERD